MGDDVHASGMHFDLGIDWMWAVLLYALKDRRCRSNSEKRSSRQLHNAVTASQPREAERSSRQLHNADNAGIVT